MLPKTKSACDQFDFEEVKNLSIMDFKAQKKTPNLKQFMNESLTPQELVKMRLLSSKYAVHAGQLPPIMSPRYYRTNKERKETMARLVKKPLAVNNRTVIGTIINQCDKLQGKVISKRKLKKL